MALDADDELLKGKSGNCKWPTVCVSHCSDSTDLERDMEAGDAGDECERGGNREGTGGRGGAGAGKTKRKRC